MANFYSNLGKWIPAKEYAVDPNAPRGKEIYDGLDRDALDIMRQAGLIDPNTNEIRSYMGEDIRQNLEMMDLARSRNFSSVEEMLMKRNGWKKEDFERLEKRKVDTVVDHKNPEPRPALKEMGGGIDTTRGGKNSIYGGFENATAENAPRLPR